MDIYIKVLRGGDQAAVMTRFEKIMERKEKLSSNGLEILGNLVHRSLL